MACASGDEAVLNAAGASNPTPRDTSGEPVRNSDGAFGSRADDETHPRRRRHLIPPRASVKVACRQTLSLPTAHERSDVRALRSLETEFLPMAPMQPAVGSHSVNRAVHTDLGATIPKKDGPPTWWNRQVNNDHREQSFSTPRFQLSAWRSRFWGARGM